MPKRVEVYYNLHKKCLSYRPSGGRVKHAKAIILNDVSLDVQPAGRKKVLLEKKKNVHAFVRGMPAWIAGVDDDLEDYTPENMERQGYPKVRYNPYHYKTFVIAGSEAPVHKASQVVIIGKDIYLSGFRYA